MTWLEVGVITTLIMSIGTVVAAIRARGISDRQTESRVISVTVEAAEGVVALVNDQMKALSKRVEKLEDALELEQGKNKSLNMQMGKLRKRIETLEEFIIEKGHVPPPDEDS